MKKMLIFLLSLVLLLSGCDPRSIGGPSSSTDPDAPPADSRIVNAQLYQSAIQRLMQDGMLDKTWGEGGYIPDATTEPLGKGGKGGGAYYDFALTEAYQTDDQVIHVTVELKGSAWVSIKDQRDVTEGGGAGTISVGIDEYSYAPIAVAQSVVRLRDSGGTTPIEYLSCQHTRYETPGYDYLAGVTKMLTPELSASSVIDTSQYDPRLLQFLYHKVQGRRLIAGPEELTEYDLTQFIRGLNLSPYEFENFGISVTEPLDPSIFALIPRVEYVTLGVPLTDYSVFAGMNPYSINLENATQSIVDTLALNSGDLYLFNPVVDTLDLSQIQVYSLNINGDNTGRIGTIRHGETLQNLAISGVKTGDALPFSHADLPRLTSLSLDYPEGSSPPDLSPLAQFTNTSIYVSLQGSSVTPAALRGLRGVRMDSLSLNLGSNAGPWDWSLLEGIEANNISINRW